MTSYLHIFVRPNESKSGTSFKVSYNRTRNNELSWSGHSEFTIKLRGDGTAGVSVVEVGKYLLIKAHFTQLQANQDDGEYDK